MSPSAPAEAIAKSRVSVSSYFLHRGVSLTVIVCVRTFSNEPPNSSTFHPILPWASLVITACIVRSIGSSANRIGLLPPLAIASVNSARNASIASANPTSAVFNRLPLLRSTYCYQLWVKAHEPMRCKISAAERWLGQDHLELPLLVARHRPAPYRYSLRCTPPLPFHQIPHHAIPPVPAYQPPASSWRTVVWLPLTFLFPAQASCPLCASRRTWEVAPKTRPASGGHGMLRSRVVRQTSLLPASESTSEGLAAPSG